MSEYTFGVEKLGTCLEEAKPILLEHWKEIAVYDDIPLEPDYELYHQLEQIGILRIYTIRTGSDGLVGYAVYFLRRHMHYRNHSWAISDLVMVCPGHRKLGVGNRLFDFIEADLRQHGVSVMHTTSKVMHPELAFLLQSRCHKKIEEGYSFRLN